MYNKSTSEGVTIAELKLYCRVIVIKTAGIGILTDRLINGTESKTEK